MNSSYSFITATCLRDADQFELLRSSIRKFANGTPHLVAVESEDLDYFSSRFSEPGLSFTASAELLTPAIEQARSRTRGMHPRVARFRRSLNKRFGIFPNATSDGWHCQQLSKLTLASQVPTDYCINLDSDVFLTRPFEPSQFVQGGRCAVHDLHHPKGTTRWHSWVRSGEALLGLSTAREVRMHVSHPFSMRRDSIKAMLDRISNRQGMPWQEAMLKQKAGQLSEFTYYALFALRLDFENHFKSNLNQRTHWVYKAEQRARVNEEIENAFSNPDIHFVAVQADRHLPASSYVPQSIALINSAPER